MKSVPEELKKALSKRAKTQNLLDETEQNIAMLLAPSLFRILRTLKKKATPCCERTTTAIHKRLGLSGILEKDVETTLLLLGLQNKCTAVWNKEDGYVWSIL